MKDIKKILLLLSLLLTVFLSDCGSLQKNDNADKLFVAMFPNIPMNVDIKFWEPTTKFYNAKSMDLDLENNSDFAVKYAEADDVYALMFNDGNWIRLKNNDVYIPPEYLFLPKTPDYPGVTVISLTPQFSGMGFMPVNVRVVVIATIYENGQKTDKKTGAYIDVALNP